MFNKFKKLRTGFTTGTCATAASKAAMLSLINQKQVKFVEVDLPNKKRLNIKINTCEFKKNYAKCSVIKDAGDDPDVTHGAEIFTNLYLTNNINQIQIDGGTGIGKVTKPGLGLELGKAAINPVPKKMIIENLIGVSRGILNNNGIKIIISVNNGNKLALKTDNPRLGIVGGISILGTSGIVIPYSTASFAASIRQNLDVSIAMGNNTIVLSTGGRSESFIRKIIKLPDHCFIQMGDFAGYTMQQCAKKEIKKSYIVGFIGKFSKIASGIKQTHIRGSNVDIDFLSRLARKCNANENIISSIKNANTARHVQEIVMYNNLNTFFDEVCTNVYHQMQKHSIMKVVLDVILFDFNGNIVGRYP